MIIKDEEANLHRCLNSIKDFVDEIVIVDTGSTDNSIKIAKSYGAHVYEKNCDITFEQNGKPVTRLNFSMARNESVKRGIEVAGEDKNFWFFQIDADEELAPMDASPEEFKRRLTMIHPEVSALVTQFYEMKNGECCLPFTCTRFFRAGRNLHYIYIAHNRPKIDGLAGATDIVVHHYGYSNPETMNKKWLRTLPLLDKRLEDDPDDYNALFYRCITRIGLGDVHDGIDDGIRCMELMPEKDPAKLGFYGKLYYVIGWAYLRINDGDHAYTWFKKGLSFFPHDIDLNFSMAQLGYICKENDMLKEYAKKYFDALERYKSHLKLKFKGFFTAMPREDMSIPVRHIHNATEKSEESVREWLEVEGL